MQNDELPRVCAATLNTSAQVAKNKSVEFLNKEFELRDNYVVNSLRIWRANPRKNLRSINAIFGSMIPFMADYEFGGVRRPASGSRFPLPTLAARRGSIRKKITGKYKTGKMVVTRPPRIRGGRKRRIAAQIAIAKRTKYRQFLFIPFDRYPGIYQIKNGELELVRDFRKANYKIMPNKWMSRSVSYAATQKKLENFFVIHARRIIKK